MSPATSLPFQRTKAIAYNTGVSLNIFLRTNYMGSEIFRSRQFGHFFSSKNDSYFLDAIYEVLRRDDKDISIWFKKLQCESQIHEIEESAGWGVGKFFSKTRVFLPYRSQNYAKNGTNSLRFFSKVLAL